MKNPMALRLQRKNHAKQGNGLFFRRFWVKEPRRSEIIQERKGYRYRSFGRLRNAPKSWVSYALSEACCDRDADPGCGIVVLY